MTQAAPGTLVFTFTGPAEHSGWLIAELAEFGFGAFDEEDGRVRGYVDESVLPSGLVPDLDQVIGPIGYRLEDSRRVEPENWNATWEAGIEPVSVGRFCIHPPWHTPADGLIPLCIEPKMSFGTAHHETTRLILSILHDLVVPGQSVLDAGTGTGVLALAARKLGACRIMGFDIDPWSQENAVENLERNGETDIAILAGGIECIGTQAPFDVVIANINRAVLLDMLPALVKACAPAGVIVLSGVLVPDEAMMRSALTEVGCACERVIMEGEWIALVARRA
ncbi:MAG: ribosomal protein L11 methyltransferase [Rhodothermales bacterium]|jgi:ribosomal protein L11 methyltransferase